VNHIIPTVERTFPAVLERLDIGSVTKSSWLGSWTPGDHGRFFARDTLREGDGNGVRSFTGTWLTRLPRRVCVVAISNMSGLWPESLIFGIEGLVCGGKVVGNVVRGWKLVIDHVISTITSKRVLWLIYYHIHACGG